MEPMFEDITAPSETSEDVHNFVRRFGASKWLTPEEAGVKDARAAMEEALQLINQIQEQPVH